MSARGITSPFSVRLLLTVAVLVCGAAMSFAAGESEPAEPEADTRAELPAIGGAQDVWPFSFGLQAGYADVREALGEPELGEERVDEEGRPTIVRWRYRGLVVTFLENGETGETVVLTVRFSGPEYPLRGGVRIGMPIGEAVDLMGDPRVVDGAAHVYFYRTTTIELFVENGLVNEVVVARALP